MNRNQSLFPLGRTLATPGALGLLNKAGVSPGGLLDRHRRGDWGDVPEEDARANTEALASGARVLSAYRVVGDSKVWIITEADRSATTVLLPSEEY